MLTTYSVSSEKMFYLEKFYKNLNKLNNSITFTYESGGNELPFLDIKTLDYDRRSNNKDTQKRN